MDAASWEGPIEDAVHEALKDQWCALANDRWRITRAEWEGFFEPTYDRWYEAAWPDAETS